MESLRSGTRTAFLNYVFSIVPFNSQRHNCLVVEIIHAILVLNEHVAIGTSAGVKLVNLNSGREMIYITGNFPLKQLHFKNMVVVLVFHLQVFL